jgi:hypothetical protein
VKTLVKPEKMPLAVFLGTFREDFRGNTNVYSTCKN